MKSTGDGILATFDAPTRALRCAFGLNAGLGSLGLVIGSAIHTGEIEFRDHDIGGIGVHVAARALALAGDRCSRRFRASMERGGGGHPVPGGDRAGLLLEYP